MRLRLVFCGVWVVVGGGGVQRLRATAALQQGATCPVPHLFQVQVFLLPCGVDDPAASTTRISMRTPAEAPTRPSTPAPPTSEPLTWRSWCAGSRSLSPQSTSTRHPARTALPAAPAGWCQCRPAAGAAPAGCATAPPAPGLLRRAASLPAHAATSAAAAHTVKWSGAAALRHPGNLLERQQQQQGATPTMWPSSMPLRLLVSGRSLLLLARPVTTSNSVGSWFMCLNSRALQVRHVSGSNHQPATAGRPGTPPGKRQPQQ